MNAWFPHKIKVESIILFLIFSNILSYAQSYYEVLTSNCPHYQKQANIWYFGKNAGLDFNTMPVTVLLNNNSIGQLENNATISDSLGNFRAATGGYSKLFLWIQKQQNLEIEFDLLGNISTTQSSLIIPKPGNENIYYIFSLNVPHPIFDTGLAYSIVSFDPNIDSLQIVLKNEMILSKVSEKITAVKHSNGKDIWVVIHKWDSNEFYSYLISEDGLNSQPVISAVGSYHSPFGADINQAIGQMKFSPDGKKLALAIYGKNKYEIFDFNNNTGNIFNTISSPEIYQGAYGVEFSADGNYLFCSNINVDGSLTFESFLMQFDVKQNENIFTSGIQISNNTNGCYFGGLQLATNGKIYVAHSPEGDNYLGVINNPTRPGIECNYNLINNIINEGLFLEGRTSQYGLPNFIQSYFLIPKFQYSNNCIGDVTQFHLVNISNVDSVLWNFGDGNYSRDLESEFQYSSSGIHEIIVTDYFNGKGYGDSFQINVNSLPEIEINGGIDTLVLLPDSRVTLDAGSGYKTYSWSTGEEQQMIDVSKEGTYVVEISNNNCCFKSDSIFVRLFKAFAPTAFSPNKDNVNDEFVFFYLYDKFKKYKLEIFDRYGKLVFQTTDPNLHWNGRLNNNGIELPIETYIWQLQIRFDIKSNYLDKGTITLLR